jgi:hypothetical protein
MSDQDWRSPKAYDYLQDLSAPGLAWEFLRRNVDYRADYANPDIRAALDAGAAGSTRRWGLRFRGGSPTARRRSKCLLAA